MAPLCEILAHKLETQFESQEQHEKGNLGGQTSKGKGKPGAQLQTGIFGLT